MIQLGDSLLLVQNEDSVIIISACSPCPECADGFLDVIIQGDKVGVYPAIDGFVVTLLSCYEDPES